MLGIFIYMKFVITEDKRERLIDKYLLDEYGGLIRVDEKRLNFIFFLKDNGKDELTSNDIIFNYDTESQTAMISWDMVDSIRIFTGNEWESEQFVKRWLKKTYGVNVTKLYRKY